VLTTIESDISSFQHISSGEKEMEKSLTRWRFMAAIEEVLEAVY